MKFRVGQRVRLLTESGEGVITQLLDEKHVEVDLGDDFPLDVHVDDLVEVDSQLSSFYGSEEEEKKKDSLPKKLGQLFELSLAITRKDATTYQCLIINPEPLEILYTCYAKVGGSYRGMAAGQLPSGEVQNLGSLSNDEMLGLKAWYLQSLAFRPGKGHPQAAAITQLDWNKSRLKEAPRYIEALEKEGWIFSLRERPTQLEVDVNQRPPSLKQPDLPPRPQKIIDLHLEALGPMAKLIKGNNVLPFQLKRAEEAFSEALAQNCTSLVLIHGVGEGKLKEAVWKKFEGNPHVKELLPADSAQFGSGATQILFK